jgi:hypothetical protein
MQGKVRRYLANSTQRTMEQSLSKGESSMAKKAKKPAKKAAKKK